MNARFFFFFLVDAIIWRWMLSIFSPNSSGREGNNYCSIRCGECMIWRWILSIFFPNGSGREGNNYCPIRCGECMIFLLSHSNTCICLMIAVPFYIYRPFLYTSAFHAQLYFLILVGENIFFLILHHVIYVTLLHTYIFVALTCIYVTIFLIRSGVFFCQQKRIY